MSSYIEIEIARLVNFTDKALLIEIEDEEYWIPRGQIEGEGKEFDRMNTLEWNSIRDHKIYCTEWILNKLGIGY
jgi:hypothetical protein